MSNVSETVRIMTGAVGALMLTLASFAAVANPVGSISPIQASADRFGA